MSRYLLPAVVFFMLSTFPTVAAECGHDSVEVSGDDEEIAVACGALDGVLAYFAEAGYIVVPTVTISFQDEVWFEPEAGGGPRLKVSGCFDMRRATIEITRWKVEPASERRPWGVAWDRPIVASILQHELVHMATTSVLAEHHFRLGGAWHEFVAYAVQFALMEPEMRDRILADHATIAPFEMPWAVSPLSYAANPDAFGLRAYLYAQERGGMAFIRQILKDEVEDGTGETSHICPWK